ncbi:MAG: HisA/HisF family protein [Methanobrevibacter sp.]|jgi:phosphoribosylformimino-5-aminoimidazole carboxamide ribotide isomerase|nr:HisA/HisF family protein [Candidatus Methanoflexus mossambicus]
MVEIVPVMDLINTIAVSGKSGERKTYKPLNSIYSHDSNPVSIAHALKINNFNEIYIADLDLIERKGNNLQQVKLINSIIPVMLDCGIRNFDEFKFFLDFAYKLIIATETLDSIDELHKIFNKFPKERIVVSVDIKDNELYSKSENFNLSLDEFINELESLNPNEIILLDISKVGTFSGVNQKLISKFSTLNEKIVLGGGITKEDLELMDDLGVKKVLIGSAIHNGEIK